MSKPKITIIGLGRFGRVLAKMLGEEFSVIAFDQDSKKLKPTGLKNVIITKDLSKALESPVIFYAVPIGKFKSTINSHRPYLSEQHLVIDVLSVKTHPAAILQKLHETNGTRAILTHPLFGPDSTQGGFEGKILALDSFTATKKEAELWKSFFTGCGIRVIEMSPKKHDQLAAYSQGLTHFMGRLLSEMKFRKTEIDTDGAKRLQEVMEQTCNDTWELFHDLETYNPYTMEMREKLIEASVKVTHQLLPKRIDKNSTIIGIQGGRGSFNEIAAKKFISENKIKNANLKYLFVTKKVLKELNRGQIDLGIFAIGNSRGGLVDESLNELGKYRFKIIGKVVIPIQHFLMKRKDVPISGIKQIMAHDQVFRQCEKTLSLKYPDFVLVEGKGDLRDTAKAALALSRGKIDKNTAILGNISLADIFNFEIIGEHLEDDKNNRTTFLVVEREG